MVLFQSSCMPNFLKLLQVFRKLKCAQEPKSHTAIFKIHDLEYAMHAMHA